MRILITGADGRLGSALAERLAPHHTLMLTDQHNLDITDPSAVREQFADHTPDLVLHCAAMTAVDECARHPEKANAINGYGTKHIVLACQAQHIPMVYVSTNEVFDGTYTGFVHEYAPQNPINAYGYSKWMGEQIVRDHLSQFYIVRTSWLFAHGGRNFVQAIAQRAKDGHPMKVVINEVATPTYTDDLADGIVRLIATEQYGIYHLVNEGRASRWQFAREILNLMGMQDTPIEKITAAEYPRPSSPPEYSVLANTAAKALGITLRPWQAALQDFMQKEGWL